MNSLIVFLKILVGYLLGDFIMGIFHWIKDTYFDPHTPIIGKKFIWNSRLHHLRPHYVCEFDDWTLFSSSAQWTFLWMSFMFILFGVTPFTLSLYLTISLNDVIHKYSHMTNKERSRLATFLQKLYIFQSPKEHRCHHTPPYDSHYCPITPYVNNILEKINFWKFLEKVIEKYLGVKPRAHSDHFIEDPQYPAGIKFIQQ